MDTVGSQRGRLRRTLDLCQLPTASHGWHFYSTELASRTPRNSLKTKDAVPFYPSQKRREQF